MKMRPFRRLLPVEVALDRLLRAAVPVTGEEEIPLPTALGRVAARPYRSPRSVPEFPRATWDGFAVRSRDTRTARPDRPVHLHLAGEVYAEERLSRPLGQGEAVAIATGGAMPRGSDSVVIFEEARAVRGAIEVRRPVPVGERVAGPGADFPRGELLVGRGAVLDPAGLGALAATGRSSVRVYRRPIVTLLPNGNELVSPGRPLGRGQVYEINNTTLASVIQAGGGVSRPIAPVRDDPATIERAIRAAMAGSDLVLVTGGSSVGEHDYLPQILPRLGRLLFHGVAVRPGKPTLAAVRGRTLLLGMPGHPTSCLSNGFWLLLPVLRRLARLPGPGWVEAPVRLGTALDVARPGLSSVVPLRVDGGVAVPTFKDSSAITSLSGANAYLLRPPGAGALSRGRTVAVRLLPWPLANAPLHEE